MENREIVRKLNRIYDIEKSKEKDNLALYNTGEKVHAKQIAFHKCPKRNRWVFGGNKIGRAHV